MAKLDSLVVGARDTRGKHGGLCLCLGSFRLLLLNLALQGRLRLVLCLLVILECGLGFDHPGF